MQDNRKDYAPRRRQTTDATSASLLFSAVCGDRLVSFFLPDAIERRSSQDGAAGGLCVVLGELPCLGYVPAGVVVGVQRRLPVAGGAAGLQVAGGGEDRVPRVVGAGGAPGLAGSAETWYCAQVAGVNCIQPIAPAVDTERLWPKLVSISLIAAR